MKEHGKRSVKGIKISVMNIIMIVVSCILYVILIMATVSVSGSTDVLVKSLDDYISCEENASLLMSGSDYLSEQVRLYIVTHDVTYVDAYFMEAYVTKRRDQAMKKLEKFDISEEAYEYLKSALENSNHLMNQEVYAIKLVSLAVGDDMNKYPDIMSFSISQEDHELNSDEKIEKARSIVFGADYQDAKESIQKNTASCLRNIVGETMLQEQNSVSELRRTVYNQQMIVSILFLEDIVTFILIIILVAKPLRIYSKNIREEKKLELVGSYEFKHLAVTYNHIYELNAASKAMLQHQTDMLRHQAEHDPLTGIINRGAFNRLMNMLKNHNKPMALMIIDVDKFKQINDGYGHEMGDRVLKKIANLLKDSFRNTDFPARIGGDEFSVIVTDITIDLKSVIIKKVNAINTVLMNPIDDLAKTSLSVGVAFSERGFAEDLYRKADMALYDIKEHGRCGCRFYEEMEGKDHVRRQD